MTPTPLAGEHLRPLGQLSVKVGDDTETGQELKGRSA